MKRIFTDEEKKAFDAIIAALLRPDMSDEEVSAEEIRRYIEGRFELSEEDEAALIKLDENVFERTAEARTIRNKKGGSNAE